MFSSSTMARSPIESIDFKLFQDDFKNIDQKFLQSVVSIFIIFNYEKSKLKKEFLMMTEKATYAYGEEICSWLSLKHDMTKPQRISLFNDFGQLGLGDEEDRDIPYLVAFSDPDSTRIKNIVAGEDYSLFLFKNGQVCGCGSNYNGVLGLGDTEIRSTPTKIPIENVKQIACSKFDSFLLANDGSSYYAWGKAKYRKWSSPKRFDDHPTGELGLGDENNRSILTKIPIENVQQIACSIFNSFSLVYDGSSYYAWGETKHDPNWSSPRKLNDSHSSFAYASVQVLDSPLTFGLTSTIYEFGSHDSLSYKSILRLFDNQDNYDVKFKIDNDIKSGKFYLKSVSKYYRRMFSGNWSENDQVIINDYSYEAYYAYIRMLHTGKIHINRQNITELVDLANCYGDERLMEYCQTFIRSDLNAQTMTTHLPLIIKYKMKEFVL
ncbi:RCC1 and BTB domain-containing protein 1 [Dermatophagoides farinae]|uniref:RCC1 and BTB domain-containing protein 1 n=1 Tax=Dermatophagoides farinae TaxID=6954 RepID=A0A922HSB7_DERFA|nr:RCC1 and BTB domain-containing protein 1 [Dermatophagoides farinae]